MPEAIFPFPYDKFDFPNQLRLITVPAPFPSVVSIYIVVQAGSRNEVEPGKSGFAHFFEHMMFRGTPLYPPDRYEGVLQETGAASNAYTDDDRTVYHTTVTREDIETILAMEADRFQNLEYPLEAFRTEALAVYGEYNKDSADPIHKLFEVLRDTAFDVHTYKHTTMGFLPDIVEMPNQYDYSRVFFNRFYRPEYTTLVLAGAIQPEEARAMVSTSWGGWERGNYRTEVPVEPEPGVPRTAHIPWKVPTLPHLLLAFRNAAYSDQIVDSAALDLISYLGFSESSPLYEELVIDRQSVDLLWANNSDHVDPYLFTVLARVKEKEELQDVQDRILRTFAGFAESPVDEDRLEAVKSHLCYRFALSLNNSESIASTVAHYVSLRRTPETVNRLYERYDEITPQVLQRVAARYFTPAGRTLVTLAS